MKQTKSHPDLLLAPAEVRSHECCVQLAGSDLRPVRFTQSPGLLFDARNLIHAAHDNFVCSFEAKRIGSPRNMPASG